MTSGRLLLNNVRKPQGGLLTVYYCISGGFSELGSDNSAEADGIISGFRCRRIYTRSVLSRSTADVSYSLVLFTVICSTTSSWTQRPETANQGKNEFSFADWQLFR